MDNGSSVSGEQHLSAEITGLSASHTYHYRVAASNSFGVTYGEDEAVSTPSAPTIDGLSSANLTATSADLMAAINPQGFQTTYKFEYGVTEEYGSSASGAEISENLFADNSVEVHLENLQRGVIYHFRLLATNEWGTAASEDQTFNFFPARCPNEQLRQETNSAFLPDCRAYELVSPSSAGSAVLLPEGAPAAPNAEGPSRFAFAAVLGALPGSNSPDTRGDTYVATRTASGWVSHYVGILGSEHLAAANLGELNLLSDSSMDKLIDFDNPSDPTVIRAPFAWDAEGNSLGRWPQGVGNLVLNGDANVGAFQPSPDFTHLVISSNNVEWAPGGLTHEPGSVYDYDTTTGDTSLISRMPNGGSIEQEPSYNPSPPNESPVPASFIELPNYFPKLMRRGIPSQYQQGVSPDGTRILMAVPTGAPCSMDSYGCEEPAAVHLYIRISDAITIDVSQGHVRRLRRHDADASKVYFISAEQLTSEDHDTSADLYMWSQAPEEEGQPLTLISGGNANSGLGNSDNCSSGWTAKCGVASIGTGSLYEESVHNSGSR